MATPKQVTEPATAPAHNVTEPELPKYRIPNPEDRAELARVRDAKTGDILPNRVPRTWLDGRFPQLKEVPSNKKGK